MLDGLLLVLGPSEGSLLRDNEGVSDGVSDGSSALGIETGAAVIGGLGAGQAAAFVLQIHEELMIGLGQSPPLVSQHNR